MPRTRRRQVVPNFDAIETEDRSSERITVDANSLSGEDGSGSSELVRDLLGVSQLVAKARSHVARDAGVTAFQLSAVMAISEMRSVAVGALAAALSVSSQFISSEIAKLEAAGIVQRRPKENDTRGSMIGLTRRGRELVRKSGPARKAADESILQGATAEQMSSFRKVMSIMRKNCRRSSDRSA